MLCLICSDNTSCASAATRTSTSSNYQQPGGIDLDHAARAQHVDKVLEQAAVEEFR